MTIEIFLEVFYIKINIKTNLTNITENTNEINELKAIKNKNTITFMIENTKNKIIINNNELVLIRDNPEFSQKIIFTSGKETKSEYFIKEYNTTLNINILTTNLTILPDKIKISYKIVDSEELYDYQIEIIL